MTAPTRVCCSSMISLTQIPYADIVCGEATSLYSGSEVVDKRQLLPLWLEFFRFAAFSFFAKYLLIVSPSPLLLPTVGLV